MADATKYQPLHSRTLISDLKNLFTILKTRRTSAFVYVFMFAFVGFTVFLAFSPSSNSSAPWFTNIFSTGSNTGSVGSTSDSYRSQFSSLFSYFFPNNSSPQKVPNFTDSSPPPPPLLPPIDPQNNLSRSSNTTSLSPTLNRVPSTKAGVLKPNQTSNQNSNQTHKANSSLPPFPSANEQQPIVKSQNQNQAQNSTNSNKVKGFLGNQTTIMKPVASVVSNKSVSLPAEVGRVSNVTQKAKISNYTAPLSKKQSNETKSVVSVKQGSDDLVKSLMGCDIFDGEWVKDDSYPLYKPGSCSLIDEQFNCIHNGRHDKDYQKYKWKPKRCTLPRLDGKHLLNLLRGKRLVFVGDSLNRNMWESLVCILRNSAKDPRKVFEAHGRHHFRGEASYSFVFKDYDCTVEFFVSPFLVQEWEMPDKNGLKKETLRLDLVGRSSDFYKDADVIIFNTGHWWTHDKTSKGKDYYQEGSHVYGELNVLEAFRKALTTWARWVDANVNPTKSIVFFRGYSASHFSGGQWNSGGQCDHETEPIMNETYLNPYPPKMMVLEKVLRNMKTHVNYLNITRMTDFRKDGHPSIYRKQNLSPEERRSPSRFQDCSHWCLPGVPDAWNEAVYAQLLVKLQQQKKA